MYCTLCHVCLRVRTFLCVAILCGAAPPPKAPRSSDCSTSSSTPPSSDSTPGAFLGLCWGFLFLAVTIYPSTHPTYCVSSFSPFPLQIPLSPLVTSLTHTTRGRVAYEKCPTRKPCLTLHQTMQTQGALLDKTRRACIGMSIIITNWNHQLNNKEKRGTCPHCASAYL